MLNRLTIPALLPTLTRRAVLRPSAALVHNPVDETPRQLGNDDAIDAADGGAGAAAAQIARIIQDKRPRARG
jgi:hypothetical protein